MGYHIGTTSIERVKKFLQILLETKESTVVFKAKRVRNQAHLLRQGLLASELAENEYKDLKKQWRVREQTDCIICTKKEDESPEVIQSISTIESVVETVKDSGIPFPSVKRVEEVVGVCLEHKHKAMLFPNFIPNAGEMAVLQRWGDVQRIEFYYTDNKLTMRRK